MDLDSASLNSSYHKIAVQHNLSPVYGNKPKRWKEQQDRQDPCDFKTSVGNGFNNLCKVLTVFFWSAHVTSGQNGWEVNSLIAENSRGARDI